MVVNVIKWRPWPPLLSKKFEVKLVVKKMEGNCDSVHGGPGKAVEIRWKGPKISLSSFRRTVKRNFTREEKVVDPDGVVLWDEEFHTMCTLSGYKDNVFHPWEIGFTVLNGLNPGPKNKVPVIGTATLNLAEFAPVAEEKDLELSLPLTVTYGAPEPRPSLHIQLSMVELRAAQEPAESMQIQSQTAENPSVEKDELSALKAGLRKVKIFTEFVSIRRGKKTSREYDQEINESRSEGDYSYSDSLDESEGESNEGKDDDSTIRKSFSYGTLAYANCTGGSLYEDGVYYSYRKSNVGCSQVEDSTVSVSVSEPFPNQSSIRRILPWKKRKLNLRSPKARGEPLLKKAYAEEGGDDIDFDRRQLDSCGSFFGWLKEANGTWISEFGDDNFAVGSWEPRDIISRDRTLKLQTQVFFASIDQRSERAAGESACTALVAVIANWFQNNPDLMPVKSQLDSLIRDGSLEWRNLCDNETYGLRFPDKHFDLETVIEANVRQLSVVPRKSFIGFFHPEEIEEGQFDFLHGAMSFDGMWDEIRRESEVQTNDEPQVYIVSWNDHFFVLKVESEAYYIIDTLGERLFEGCSQAYILKFDQNTAIYELPVSDSPDESTAVVPETTEVICRGKECCKEYIKSFLAAIPIRELEADIKKGLLSSAPLHHRLQIEFHYTRLQPRPAPVPVTDVSAVPGVEAASNLTMSAVEDPVLVTSMTAAPTVEEAVIVTAMSKALVVEETVSVIALSAEGVETDTVLITAMSAAQVVEGSSDAESVLVTAMSAVPNVEVTATEVAI